VETAREDGLERLLSIGERVGSSSVGRIDVRGDRDRRRGDWPAPSPLGPLDGSGDGLLE